ncbi:MAG: SOS response-associated peptidase [Deltaproteobacteria bacterium]|jgi:putative SOS response-associated peptidase YedK|nr:SOS response-associated peptidase [Deltaproteobacteria bacterium]
MCGRFAAINLEDGDETARFLKGEAESWTEGGFGFRAGGDVFPGDTAPVMVLSGDRIGALPMKWGFPGFPDRDKPDRKPRPLINARSETAGRLPTWRGPLKSGRCLVPVAGFYEWSHAGGRRAQKWSFVATDGGRLFLAGLFRDNPDTYKGQVPRLFAIVTAAADASMEDVHDRMPVCVPRPSLDSWLGADYERVLGENGAPFAKLPA